MWQNRSDSYGSVAKTFHWLIAILLLGMLAFGYFLDNVPKSYQPIAYNMHKLTGLTILSLMLLRLLWAFINIKPALPFGTPAWERKIERIVHGFLYAAVIAMPIAGWIGSDAAGRPPHLGDFSFDLPLNKNPIIASVAFDWHGTLALVIIALVSLHTLAALFHHFIKRDNVLRRMLP